MAGGAYISLIGCVGKDPKTRTNDKGYAVTVFPVACDEGYKSDRTLWLEIAAYGALGDVCQKFIRKGNLVSVVGALRRDEWVDKGSGVVRCRDKVEAKFIDMLDKPRHSSAAREVGDPDEQGMDFNADSPVGRTPVNGEKETNTPPFNFDPSSNA